MDKTCRYKSIDMKSVRSLIFAFMILLILSGCGKKNEETELTDTIGETAEDSFVDFKKLREENPDIFAWINIPDTDIDYPVLQAADGDDEYYVTHNAEKKPDTKGAIHIEAANLNDMCDFNEVLHGSSPSDGSMFSPLKNFLDRAYFDEHPYIYIYMDGNALVYYTFAAYTRDNTRLLEEYDFSYASGCEDFLSEIYGKRSMNRIIRSGWENMVEPENFLITLSTVDPDSYKQIVVVGCLVGDVTGKIDRVIDYSDPDEN